MNRCGAAGPWGQLIRQNCEGEGQESWGDGAGAVADASCLWVDYHAEAPQEIYAKDGAFYIALNEVKAEIMFH